MTTAQKKGADIAYAYHYADKWALKQTLHPQKIYNYNPDGSTDYTQWAPADVWTISSTADKALYEIKGRDITIDKYPTGMIDEYKLTSLLRLEAETEVPVYFAIVYPKSNTTVAYPVDEICTFGTRYENIRDSRLINGEDSAKTKKVIYDIPLTDVEEHGGKTYTGDLSKYDKAVEYYREQYHQQCQC